PRTRLTRRHGERGGWRARGAKPRRSSRAGVRAKVGSRLLRVLIAIDGPSGAGKGTVSRAVAEALGCRHIDTGAMYRAVAWLAIERGIGLDAEDALVEVVDGARFDLSGGRVRINDHDVTR